MPTICDTSSRNVRGQLKSPNYPAPYDDFTRCTYRIQAASPEYCALRLVIKDLDIERDINSRFAADCEKDSLELSGDIKLCGRDLAKSECKLVVGYREGAQRLKRQCDRSCQVQRKADSVALYFNLRRTNTGSQSNFHNVLECTG